MTVDPDISAVAAVLADRSRAAILLALVDGRAYPATELARIAGVSSSTTSSHLNKLLDHRFITVESAGRHRYYRLAPDVAHFIESFAIAAPRASVRTAVDRFRSDALVHARTCYDHLAGRLGVAIAQSLETHGAIIARDRDYDVTPSGQRLLSTIDIDVDQLQARRAFARRCLDWSERQPHIAGALGAAMATRCFELGWIERVQRSRAVRITPRGRRDFAKTFDVRV